MKQVIVTILSLLIVSTMAFADWNEGEPYKMHFPQLPDLNPTGMDVLASTSYTSGADGQGKFLADDFLCTQTGPISDIHIWGSWLDDKVPVNSGGIVGEHGTFTLAIYSDLPATENPLGYSMPDQLLWTRNFRPSEYESRLYASGQESFFDPNLNQIVGSDTEVWQYNFLIDPAEAYVQKEDTIYWLGVHNWDPNGDGVINDADLTTPFGWKTSDRFKYPDPYTGNHFQDDAVWVDIPTVGLPVITPPGQGAPWQELRYPLGHDFEQESIDLAFVITPEPGSMLLLLCGAVAAFRRRK